MREAWEKVQQTYNSAKESIKNKWEGFKKKFEGTKSEMSQEVMKAESPEDLITLGKKLQEQGEALKAEKVGIGEEEEKNSDENLEGERQKIEAQDYDEAIQEDKDRTMYDEAKAEDAERTAAKEKLEKEKLEQEAKDAEMLSKLRAENGEVELLFETGEQNEENIENFGIMRRMVEKTEKLLEYKEELMSQAEEMVNSQGREIASMPAGGEKNDAFKKLATEVAETLKLGREAEGGIVYENNPSAYNDKAYPTVVSFIDTLKRFNEKSDQEGQEVSGAIKDYEKRLENLKTRGQEIYEKLALLREGSKNPENKEYQEKADQLLRGLYDEAVHGRLDPFWGNYSENSQKNKKELMAIIEKTSQSSLAQNFFNETIGKSISNNSNAYMVYGFLKGTEFASKFKELESARLVKAGYSEFNL